MGDLVLDVRESPAAARRAAAELVDDLDRARHSAQATGDEDAGGAQDGEAGEVEDADGAATESLTPGDPLAMLQRHEDYLHGVREPWGVTLAETQDVLTRLAGLEQPPASHVRLERDVLTRSASTGLWRRSTETAFYLSSTAITAARAASAIRDHWKIENTSHYSRDVTMGEDRSRIRINPGIFAKLRSFAFNILKSNRRSSLAQDRFRAAIGGLDRLLNLLRIPER